MNKKISAALLALTGLTAASNASAGLLFDFQDGNGGIDVGAWDWAQTSFAAVGGVTAIENFATDNTCPGSSCNFVVLTHARLTGVTDQAGADVTPAGLNTDFEVTLTMAFVEQVTGLLGTPGQAGAIATFTTLSSQGEFLEIFYDTTPDFNDVQGFGFNDGTLILQGGLVPGGVAGLFLQTGGGLPANSVQLDQSPGAVAGPGTDDYGDGSGIVGQSQLTINGTGSNDNLPFDALTTDPTFFLTPLDTFGITFENISVGLPFGTVNPSDCFTDNTAGIAVGAATAAHDCAAIHVDGLYAAQGPDPLGGLVPVVGNINGAPSAVSFPGGAPARVDIVFQTDFNSPFTPVAVMPEPGSLALLGIGLSALGAAGIRRRRRSPTA